MDSIYMDGFAVVGLIVMGLVVIIGIILYFLVSSDKEVVDEIESDSTDDSPSTDTPPSWVSQSHASVADAVGSFDLLNRLPFVFYVLAVIGGVVVLMSMFASKELSGAEAGAMLGYTVGAVLSMFAVGRIIEVLHQIRDAVRNTPALSPGRSDDE